MRLIDADALLGRIMADAPGFLDGGSEITKAFIMAMINTKSVTPTVDAIQVVRCRDCKYRNDLWNCHIAHEGYTTTDDWFCADGERSDKS